MLSIDPSINDCGYAGWDGGKPIEYGLIHPPRRLRDWRLKAHDVKRQIEALVAMRDPLFVICESPNEVFDKSASRVDPGDGTLKLAYLVGSLASSVHVAPAQPRFFLEVSPSCWKGRGRKTATLALVNTRYGVNLTDEKRDLDIADAIGIGDWFKLFGHERHLGDGLYATCSAQRMELLKRALSTTGWKQ